MSVAAGDLAPWIEMALAAIHREYPVVAAHVLREPSDLALPSIATPAFRGAFDWHSAVHGHWALVRSLRAAPGGAFAARARSAVSANLTPERLAAERTFLSKPGREGFELPYGLAWLLQLCAELREWRDDDAGRWSAALAPLEVLAASRIGGYFTRLPVAVRGGEHAQSAFALGLALDWARTARDDALASRLSQRSLDYFGGDVDAPIRYEPGGTDFLSPVLAEADLMRRVLPGERFAEWFSGFLPTLDSPAAARWLEPVRAVDRGDGKLAHWDGLNLSRAWMLEAIAEALPAEAPPAGILRAAAERHRRMALAGARTTHYAGTHWLGSFAIYLLTGRGREV